MLFAQRPWEADDSPVGPWLAANSACDDCDGGAELALALRAAEVQRLAGSAAAVDGARAPGAGVGESCIVSARSSVHDGVVGAHGGTCATRATEPREQTRRFVPPAFTSADARGGVARQRAARAQLNGRTDDSEEE